MKKKTEKEWEVNETKKQGKGQDMAWGKRSRGKMGGREKKGKPQYLDECEGGDIGQQEEERKEDKVGGEETSLRQTIGRLIRSEIACRRSTNSSPHTCPYIQ